SGKCVASPRSDQFTPKGLHNTAQGRVRATWGWRRVPKDLHRRGCTRKAIMSQSFTQIYLHIVYSTKNRAPFLSDKAFRVRAHAYLAGALKKLESPAIVVGGRKPRRTPQM